MTMRPPKWTDRYNCHRLVLAQGSIILAVDWSGTEGYRVKVNDIGLAKRSTELADAKQMAIDFARKIMQHANHQLDVLRMQEG